MVNYCCVVGCGRNSRLNPNLTFYSLPKEDARRIQWLKAGQREDLLNTDLNTAHRFCSRHFETTYFKNRHRHLSSNAVPTLLLPGRDFEQQASDEMKVVRHKDLACDNCGGAINGFRYKCVQCPNYDLCHTCEANENHAQHVMVRIPKPIMFVDVEKLSKAYQKIFKEDPISTITDSDSDNEPITKYASKPIENLSELSEEVKRKIRKEVDKALNKKIAENPPKDVAKNRKRKLRNITAYKGHDIEQVSLNEGEGLIEFAAVTESHMYQEVPLTMKEESHVAESETTSHSKISEDELREFIIFTRD